MLWIWLLTCLLHICRVSCGDEKVALEMNRVDNGASLHAAKAIARRIGVDYADREPPKLYPEKSHFEYNVSFYADADHFDEEPVGLRKELYEIIQHLDDWVESLRESKFSVKLHYTLKVFAPKDPDRIGYNFQDRKLYAQDVFKIMKMNKLVMRDPGHIVFLLVPYKADQDFFSGSSSRPEGGIRGVASPMEFRELGIGLSMVYTKKWLIEQTVVKQSSGGYKWRHEGWLCLARRTCSMQSASGGGIPRPPDAPKYHFEREVMFEAVKAGLDTNPTIELLDAHIARNLSWHQKTWIGVTAHEIGHLLGAPERGLLKTRDDERMMWDVMLNPVAGTRYGDTSKYAIFLNIACELRLKNHVYTPRLNIYSRDCQVPGGEDSYYRRYPSFYAHRWEVENTSPGDGRSSLRIQNVNNDEKKQTEGRSDNQRQTTGTFENHRQIGGRLVNQRQKGGRFANQKSTGSTYYNQRQTGRRFDSQRQIVGRPDNKRPMQNNGRPDNNRQIQSGAISDHDGRRFINRQVQTGERPDNQIQTKRDGKNDNNRQNIPTDISEHKKGQLDSNRPTQTGIRSDKNSKTEGKSISTDQMRAGHSPADDMKIVSDNKTSRNKTQGQIILNRGADNSITATKSSQQTVKSGYAKDRSSTVTSQGKSASVNQSPPVSKDQTVSKPSGQEYLFRVKEKYGSRAGEAFLGRLA